MTPEERLQRLIEAERSQAPTAVRADRGFERLQEALGAQVPPIDIGPVDPTLLAGSGAVGKLVALPWAAKVTAIAGVVVSTGVLVGNQLGSANPPRPPAALASASPASVAPPRSRAASASGLAKAEDEVDIEGESLAAPPSMPTPSAGPARPMPLPPLPAPGTTPFVARDGAQDSPAAPGVREPSVKSFEDVPPKAVAPAPAFDAELALIKRAKAEFDAGRDQVARAWLNEHARRFPAGVFAAEREGLLVLSTCRANPSAGGAGALVFLRRYPQSPLAERIRRSCRLE